MGKVNSLKRLIAISLIILGGYYLIVSVDIITSKILFITSPFLEFYAIAKSKVFINI